ncbi:hypothetical protein HFO96_13370 [Rhizobium leguminosarum]|nr:hypothetical protein [Rhizobium leguminosarum]
MKVDRLTTLIFAGSFALASTGFAQDAPKKPHVPLEKAIGQVTPTGPVPSLAVINSAGAKIENGKLILTGVSANSIVFADRPVRAAGHVTTEQFIMQWDDGKDNFAVDPPNATVSVLGGEGSDVSDAVVTLKTPKLDGTTLTFDIAILEGSLSGATGPAALFIDHFGGSFGGGGAVASMAAALAAAASAAAVSAAETSREVISAAASMETTCISATRTSTVSEVPTGMRPSTTGPGIAALPSRRAWSPVLPLEPLQRGPTTIPTTTVRSAATIPTRLAIDLSKGHVTFVACPSEQEHRQD